MMRSLIVTVVLTFAAFTVLQTRHSVCPGAFSNLDLIEAEQQQRLLLSKAEEVRSADVTLAAATPEWK